MKHGLPTFPDEREPTAVERLFGRCMSKPPPNLHDWIRRAGSFADLTADDWRAYADAMRKWNRARGASETAAEPKPQRRGKRAA